MGVFPCGPPLWWEASLVGLISGGSPPCTRLSALLSGGRLLLWASSVVGGFPCGPRLLRDPPRTRPPALWSEASLVSLEASLVGLVSSGTLPTRGRLPSADPDLHRPASYRGSNTSISSSSSLNSTKSSADNAPIYFTAGSPDDDAHITHGYGLLTARVRAPHRTSTGSSPHGYGLLSARVRSPHRMSTGSSSPHGYGLLTARVRAPLRTGTVSSPHEYRLLLTARVRSPHRMSTGSSPHGYGLLTARVRSPLHTGTGSSPHGYGLLTARVRSPHRTGTVSSLHGYGLLTARVRAPHRTGTVSSPHGYGLLSARVRSPLRTGTVSSPHGYGRRRRDCAVWLAHELCRSNETF